MAQQVQVLLLDDVDGSEAAETLTFGLDGVEYEIDLTDEHAAELRDAMVQWTSHARRLGRGGGGKVQTISTRRPAATAGAQVDPKAVRAWAAANGVEVNERGRIPTEIIDRYKNRHKIAIPEAVPVEASVSAVEGQAQPTEKEDKSQPKGRGRARKTTTTKTTTTSPKFQHARASA